MIKAVADGWVREQIKPTEAAREKDIAMRKVAVIGVSEHPTLSRKAPQRAGTARTTTARSRGRAPPLRLAAPAWTPSGGARHLGQRAGREWPAHRRRDRRYARGVATLGQIAEEAGCRKAASRR